ncbi:hypothetical protein, partial [Bacteroides uniformis]|uniref:hypothetical protein n=1 Tax=Bacteroides uniformis TaxID=820 RepID=UPI0039B5A7A6
KGALLNVLRGQNRLVLGGSLHWIFQVVHQGICSFHAKPLLNRAVLLFDTLYIHISYTAK